jgi:hypothetical protein
LYDDHLAGQRRHPAQLTITFIVTVITLPVTVTAPAG